MGQIVDYSQTDVFARVAERGFPVPEDEFTAVGLLLISEPDAPAVELSEAAYYKNVDHVQEPLAEGESIEDAHIAAALKFLGKSNFEYELAKADDGLDDDDDDEPVADTSEVVALGNGWYKVGDETFHGKAALEAAGYDVPE